MSIPITATTSATPLLTSTCTVNNTSDDNTTPSRASFIQVYYGEGECVPLSTQCTGRAFQDALTDLATQVSQQDTDHAKDTKAADAATPQALRAIELQKKRRGSSSSSSGDGGGGGGAKKALTRPRRYSNGLHACSSGSHNTSGGGGSAGGVHSTHPATTAPTAATLVDTRPRKASADGFNPAAAAAMPGGLAPTLRVRAPEATAAAKANHTAAPPSQSATGAAVVYRSAELLSLPFALDIVKNAKVMALYEKHVLQQQEQQKRTQQEQLDEEQGQHADSSVAVANAVDRGGSAGGVKSHSNTVPHPRYATPHKDSSVLEKTPTALPTPPPPAAAETLASAWAAGQRRAQLWSALSNTIPFFGALTLPPQAALAPLPAMPGSAAFHLNSLDPRKAEQVQANPPFSLSPAPPSGSLLPGHSPFSTAAAMPTWSSSSSSCGGAYILLGCRDQPLVDVTDVAELTAAFHNTAVAASRALQERHHASSSTTEKAEQHSPQETAQVESGVGRNSDAVNALQRTQMDRLLERARVASTLRLPPLSTAKQSTGQELTDSRSTASLSPSADTSFISNGSSNSSSIASTLSKQQLQQQRRRERQRIIFLEPLPERYALQPAGSNKGTTNGSGSGNNRKSDGDSGAGVVVQLLPPPLPEGVAAGYGAPRLVTKPLSPIKKKNSETALGKDAVDSLLNPEPNAATLAACEGEAKGCGEANINNMNISSSVVSNTTPTLANTAPPAALAAAAADGKQQRRLSPILARSTFPTTASKLNNVNKSFCPTTNVKGGKGGSDTSSAPATNTFTRRTRSSIGGGDDAAAPPQALAVPLSAAAMSRLTHTPRFAVHLNSCTVDLAVSPSQTAKAATGGKRIALNSANCGGGVWTSDRGESEASDPPSTTRELCDVFEGFDVLWRGPHGEEAVLQWVLDEYAAMLRERMRAAKTRWTSVVMEQRVAQQNRTAPTMPGKPKARPTR